MSLRTHLGDFASIVCFKALITGVEDTLGVDGAAVVFTRAGKMRGHNLVKSLNLTGSNVPVGDLAMTLDSALGVNGTRLCLVTGARQDGERIIIEAQETISAAGEIPGSGRLSSFTMGALCGALEAVYGKMYQAEQTESVLRGGKADVFVFSPL